MCELPVATLHNLIMARSPTGAGAAPKYEMVFCDTRPRKMTYMMRVTCQISPCSDEPLSAIGHFGGSMEIAKQKAALAFMKKYFDDGSIVANPMDIDSRSKMCNMLKNICSKNGLGQPVFTHSNSTGSWVTKCEVSSLTTKGRGKTRDDAMTEAATIMIRNLTEAGLSHEVLECPKSTTQARTNDTQNCVLSNKKSETRLPGLHPVAADLSVAAETPRIRRNPDTIKKLFKLLNDHKKPGMIEENNNDSEENLNLMDR